MENPSTVIFTHLLLLCIVEYHFQALSSLQPCSHGYCYPWLYLWCIHSDHLGNRRKDHYTNLVVYLLIYSINLTVEWALNTMHHFDACFFCIFSRFDMRWASRMWPTRSAVTRALIVTVWLTGSLWTAANSAGTTCQVVPQRTTFYSLTVSRNVFAVKIASGTINRSVF